MRIQLSDFLFKLRSLIREDGQDLVEYVLLIALMAFAATAGMKVLADGVNSAFSAVGSRLTIS